MVIEISPEYDTLKEKLEKEFLEMADYSVSLYADGIIRYEDDELIISDHSKVDMSMLDLDAVRWWIGLISLDDYVKSINKFYRRKDT